MRRPFFFLFLAFALISMACRVAIPVTSIHTGPTETTDIQVPATDGVANLEFTFGAGILSVKPGLEDGLVGGKATYNVTELKPEVKINGNDITIQQGNLDTKGIPNIQGDLKNDWELLLGDAPMKLSIRAGAYEGRYEFGGLSLQKLTIADGAANVRLSFSEPNRSVMSLLRYETGASDVQLEGLANANFEEMEFRGGAGSYTLDFSGELQRDSQVTIESGISSVTIIVPEGVNAEVTFDGGLSNVSISGSWEHLGDQYTQEGSGPTLKIKIKMGAGDLKLQNP